MANDPIEAACLCRDKVFTSSSLPDWAQPGNDQSAHVQLCNCNSCRHVTGCLYASVIPWGLPEPNETSGLSWYDFSDNIKVSFCDRCGTQMFWKDRRGPSLVIMVGALNREAQAGLTYGDHCFVGDTLDGGISTWLPQVGGKTLQRWMKDGSENDEPAPDRANRAKAVKKEGDKLRASCHCGGVDFYISRPTQTTCPEPQNELQAEQYKEKWVAPDGTYKGGLCACDDCRLASGNQLVQWMFVPTDNIRSSDGTPFDFGSGTLRAYEHTKNNVRYFCSTCGAMVFWICREVPLIIDVAAGLLHSEQGARAEDWVQWSADRISYLQHAKSGLGAVLEKVHPRV